MCPLGPLRPFRVGKPEVSGVVGKAQNLSNSFLTSLAVSEIMRCHGDKEEPKRSSPGQVGRCRSGQFADQGGTLSHCQESGSSTDTRLSAAERSQIAKLAVKAREQKRKLSGKEN